MPVDLDTSSIGGGSRRPSQGGVQPSPPPPPAPSPPAYPAGNAGAQRTGMEENRNFWASVASDEVSDIGDASPAVDTSASPLRSDAPPSASPPAPSQRPDYGNRSGISDAGGLEGVFGPGGPPPLGSSPP